MQKIVLIPRSSTPENFRLMLGIPAIAMLLLIGIFWAIDYVPMRNSVKTFSLPDNFFTTFLISALLVMLLTAFAAFISMNHELIWAHDAQKGEIRLEDWYYGTPVFIRRYASKDVAGIRVWWQLTHSGSGKPVTDNPGWWKAALVLWNGTSIHLHSERGGTEHPPVEWLERFVHACCISGLELKREPILRAQPPTASIVNRLKRGQ